MVNTATGLTSSGLRDWIVQRVSAVIVAAYFVVLLIWFITHSSVTFANWQTLFHNPWMRNFSLLTLLSIMLHAWVGVWTIFTDYVKCACLRVFLMSVVAVALFAYLVWGIEIVWGA